MDKKDALMVDAKTLRIDHFRNGALSLRVSTPRDNFVQVLLSPELKDQLRDALLAKEVES